MKLLTLSASLSLSLLSCAVLTACFDNDSNTNLFDPNLESGIDVSSATRDSWNTRLYSYAEAENISVEEAERRLDIIDYSGDALTMVNDYLGESIGGAYFSMYKDDFGLNVLSDRVGDPTALDYNFLNKVKIETGVPVFIHMNATHNEGEMNKFLDKISKEFSDYKINNVDIGYDPEKDRLIVNIYGDELNSNEYSKLKEEIVKNSFGKKVEFNYLNTNLFPKVNSALPSPYIGPIVGGAMLQHGSYAESCTSGFAAYRYGVKGVLSAGHCSRGRGIERFYTNTGESYPVGKPTNNKALYMDIEFYPVKTDKPVSPMFYNDNEQIAGVKVDRIAGRSDYIKNDWVCHSGRTSSSKNVGKWGKRGESCGRISGVTSGISKYGCNGWTSDQSCVGRTYIQVSGQGGTNLNSFSGDSGGPWYKTTSDGEVIALGIHSSSSRTQIGEVFTTATFSPIYFSYDLGGIKIPTTKDYD